MNDKVLPKPVDWDELYPGRFLKASDFKGKQVTLTISEVRIEELVGDKGPQIKGVISFEKTEKQWALNKTNGLCLKAMFGRHVQEWVGKRVALFPSQWNGEICIRVYGSPDIAEDLDVAIALPRRRPFEMKMHKVGGGKRSDAGAAARIIEQSIRSATTADELKAAWANAQTSFGSDIPLPVQVAHQEMQEHLEEARS